MPDSYVTEAAITNGQVQITVRVDAFQPSDYVEISGQATQTGGAFANFYDIRQVPAEPNAPADPDDPPGTAGHYQVNVSGAPIPHQFTEEDVTVVIRVAKVWLTVLREPTGAQPSGERIGDNVTWKEIRTAEMSGGSWPPNGGSPGTSGAA